MKNWPANLSYVYQIISNFDLQYHSQRIWQCISFEKPVKNIVFAKETVEKQLFTVVKLYFQFKNFLPAGWLNVNCKFGCKTQKIPSLRICRINEKGSKKGGLCVNEKTVQKQVFTVVKLYFQFKNLPPAGWLNVNCKFGCKTLKKHFYIPSLRICRINKKGNRKGGLCVNDVKTWCEFDGWAWWKNMAINCCETKPAALRAFLCRSSS